MQRPHLQSPEPGPSSASSSSKNNKWCCDVCTYENWNTATRCTMCQTPHTPKVIFDGGADNYGMGPQQLPTTNNNNKNNSISSRSRGTSPSSYEVKWSCSMCTYLNWPRSTKCVQCLTTRKKRVSPNSSNAPAAISPRSSPPSSLNYANNASALPINAMDNLRISQQQQQQPHQDILKSFSDNSSMRFSSQNNERNLRISPSNNNIAAAGGGGKWVCSVCTYENWPRSKSCVLCKTRNIHQEEMLRQQYNNSSASLAAAAQLRNSPSPPAAASSASRSTTGGEDENPGGGTNNYDYERRMRQLRRKMREADWTWLAACMGVVEGDMNPVEAFLNGGGDPTRKLTSPEVVLLNRTNIYEIGHTLVHLAIRFHREDMLARLLSQLESSGTNSGIKCVPSYVAPDLASAIRRHISQTVRQKKGPFPCYYIAEWATYSLPPEIEDLPAGTQEQLYSELLDRDAQKELEEDDMIINWSDEIRTRLGSRLHALWNRSAGDCLLDSVLQSTWGVFDRDNVLRRAMADSLHEAGHMFYPRWKEWEISHALEMAFTLRETQLASDWSGLLNIASQPGSSLEQIHIFCLSHVLRRPIIVYGVKYVKSWRGENLGYARFEGVYLPLLWEPSFCSRSPIALGFTRGHFCALVPPEPISLNNCACAAAANPTESAKSAFLPLMTSSDDRQLLPIHFLSRQEAGREEEILREWLDVGVTDSGLLVARQKIAKPPLLVAQMTEEWLNHYRKIAQSSIAPFNSRSVAVPSANASNNVMTNSATNNTNNLPTSLFQTGNNNNNNGSSGSPLVLRREISGSKHKNNSSEISSSSSSNLKSPLVTADTTALNTVPAMVKLNNTANSPVSLVGGSLNNQYSSDGDSDEE